MVQRILDLLRHNQKVYCSRSHLSSDADQNHHRQSSSSRRSPPADSPSSDPLLSPMDVDDIDGSEDGSRPPLQQPCVDQQYVIPRSNMRLLLKLYHSLDKRVSQIEKKLTNVESKMGKKLTTIENLLKEIWRNSETERGMCYLI